MGGIAAIKVLFLTLSLDRGGAERQLVILAKGLHKRGHEVSVAVFNPNGPFEKDLKESGIPVINLNMFRRWEIIYSIVHLIKVLRSQKPDILHGYLGGPNILTILLKVVLPSHTRIVWGVRASKMNLSQYTLIDRLTYYLERMLSGFSDHIIVNSYSGLEYASQKGFPKGKMDVIQNGIDTDRYFIDRGAGGKIRAEWGIKDHETLICLVGRFDPMKDHAVFLKAASLIARHRKDVRFACIGDGTGSYRSQLLLHSSALGLDGLMLWAGTRDDMPAVYNAMEILVSSSAYGEGFPNVIGEAMACGVPCVVTDVGDSAYVVGDTGIVVPPCDPDALAEGIRKLLDVELSVLGLKARQRVVENFNLDHLVSRTENVLIGLC